MTDRIFSGTPTALPYGTEWKYFKFQVDAVRGSGLQFSELKFRKDGSPVDMTDCIASTGTTRNAERAQYALDGNIFTKYCCSLQALTIACPTGRDVDQFTFSTANDIPARDPVQWTLFSSVESVQGPWTELHRQDTNYATPVSRYTQLPWFDKTRYGTPTPPPTWGCCVCPTSAPTQAPTRAPTRAPTITPTNAPTKAPTNAPTNAPTVWETAIEVGSNGSIVTNIGQAQFNSLFASCPIVQYVRQGSVHSVYVRTSDIPQGFDAYSLFTHTWSSVNNLLHSDFNLYDNLESVMGQTTAVTARTCAESSQLSFASSEGDNIGNSIDGNANTRTLHSMRVWTGDFGSARQLKELEIEWEACVCNDPDSILIDTSIDKTTWTRFGTMGGFYQWGGREVVQATGDVEARYVRISWGPDIGRSWTSIWEIHATGCQEPVVPQGVLL